MTSMRPEPERAYEPLHDPVSRGKKVREPGDLESAFFSNRKEPCDEPLKPETQTEVRESLDHNLDIVRETVWCGTYVQDNPIDPIIGNKKITNPGYLLWAEFKAIGGEICEPPCITRIVIIKRSEGQSVKSEKGDCFSVKEFGEDDQDRIKDALSVMAHAGYGVGMMKINALIEVQVLGKGEKLSKSVRDSVTFREDGLGAEIFDNSLLWDNKKDPAGKNIFDNLCDPCDDPPGNSKI